jgi:energy-coupling factor transporter ATP-binding protein EcfA2
VTRPPLAFRTLGVRRMPGIVHGGWELPARTEGAPDTLSPGVNVVWGPNGAGKTTTAAAIQHLLWPSAGAGRPHLDARFTLDGREWRVEADGAGVRWQRDGADAPSLGGLPPATERDRYRLSLHELLSETDGGLASRILHESAGGFRVAEAAAALGFRPAARQPQALRQALTQARSRVSALRAEEERLRADEARLDDARRGAGAARARAGRRTLLERARDRRDAHDAAAAARTALDAHPAALGALRGDEATRLAELRAALADAARRRDAARSDAEEAQAALAASALPPGGLPDEVLARVAAALNEIQQLEDTRRRLEREADGAREACRREHAAISTALGGRPRETLTLAGVEELLAFARDAERHRLALAAADEALAWLAVDPPGPDGNALRDGRAALAAWLREPAPGGQGRLRAAALAAAVLLAAAGAALALLVNPGAWVLVVIALVLAAYAFTVRGEAGMRDDRRRAYERLGLEMPARWEPGEVETVLHRLEAADAAARDRERRLERRGRAEAARAALLADAAPLAARRAEIAARLGLAPDADEGMVAWLGQGVHRWQQALAAADRAEAELRAAARQHAERSGQVVEWLEPYTVGEVGCAAEVAGTLEALRSRQQAHAEARARLDAARGRLADADAAAERIGAERASLLARGGLGPDGDREMEAMCDALPAYAATRDAHLRAQQDAGTAERRLAETAGCDDELRAMPRAAIEAELSASEAAAGEADRLLEEVAALDERLRAARDRTAMEAALAAVADAEAALRDARERDEAAVAGWALKEYVEAETRDRDRPAVFHRARGLFASITRSRYRLELSDDATPAFRAVDTQTGAGCALDELSRGTRVQLLLAVRIAFIETMETAVRLPLVLDEALGNSDDQRADAVIDAVMELARAGRQVFFLTARADEAERWMERLRRSDVPHALVDLAEARGIGRFVALPRVAVEALRRRAVPAPGEMDHAAYCAHLRVPPVRPAGDAGSVHLLWLDDDLPRVHRILTLGPETWGGLRTLVEPAGPAVLGADEAAWPRLQALGRAMERLLELCRVGRGHTVDREALERSGAISATFFDRVETLRADCGGRAVALLDAVEGLPRFRTDSLAAFRAFLEEDGYLDPRPPLDDAAIRGELLTAVGPDLRAGHVTSADVERLLGVVRAAFGEHGLRGA